MDYVSLLFSTRINRKNFWGGLLFAFLGFPLILELISPLLEYVGLYSSILSWLPLSFLILFLLSISIRRLHDVDKSGLNLLLLLVPVLNLFVPIWLASSKSYSEDNKYGEEDKDFSVKKNFLAV